MLLLLSAAAVRRSRLLLLAVAVSCCCAVIAENGICFRHSVAGSCGDAAAAAQATAPATVTAAVQGSAIGAVLGDPHFELLVCVCWCAAAASVAAISMACSCGGAAVSHFRPSAHFPWLSAIADQLNTAGATGAWWLRFVVARIMEILLRVLPPTARV